MFYCVGRRNIGSAVYEYAGWNASTTTGSLVATYRKSISNTWITSSQLVVLFLAWSMSKMRRFNNWNIAWGEVYVLQIQPLWRYPWSGMSRKRCKRGWGCSIPREKLDIGTGYPVPNFVQAKSLQYYLRTTLRPFQFQVFPIANVELLDRMSFHF